MNLPSDLVSEFVEITNDKTEVKTETTVYGTIVAYEGSKYVKLDGSDLLTPIFSTTAVEDGERVTVMIKNHTALVTGNVSSPSVRTATVNEIEGRVTATETLIADKVSTKELEAEIARIDTLTADNVTIKERLTASEANIGELRADNATIKGTLTAHTANIETLNTTKLSADDADLKYATIKNLNATNADIHNLEADYGKFVELTTDNFTAANANITELQTKKLDAETANATYATIENLNATNADIDTLEGDFGSFKTLTTNNFVAANASIDELKANKLSATDADLKYANIDFSNIGKAAFEYFYANSGLISNVVVDNGTITGNLVGVTISGDLIEGNTIKAEKLVIKGSDGLYYKLNTDGITTEAEQTDENSLNGSVIKAKSITATKINVSDLVAFDATIGGFNISENSIYSGVKTTVNNTTSGIYMDKDGQIAFGDSSNYVKFYKDTDGTYKLRIAADEIKFGSGKKTITEALNDVIYKGDIPPSGTPETGALWLDTGVNPSTLRRWTGASADNVRSFEVEKSGSIVTFDNSTGYPSGELGVTTTFGPVQVGSGDASPDNVRQISGLTGTDLTRCGKNLANPTFMNSVPSINNGADVTYNGWTTGYIPIGNNVVTLSKTAISEDEIAYLLLYDENKNYIGYIPIGESSYSESSSKLNGYEKARFCRCRLDSPAGESTTTKLQLELGSTATAYEPYQGDTYSANFNQTVYGGTIDWQTGVLTVEWAHKEIDGINIKAMQAGAASGKGNSFTVTASDALIASSSSLLSEIVCSHYKTITGDYAWNGVQGICIRSTTAEIYIHDSERSAMTGAEYNAYLAEQYTAGTPLQVCYKLAEPFTIQLTPNQIIALSGQNNLYTDAGEIIVKATVSGWEVVSDYSSITSIMQNQLDGVEETANSANDIANEASAIAKTNVTTINNARLDIDSLKSVISTLVTGQNGESLMTQTENGWTFSIASVLNTLDSATQSISSLGSDLSSTNSVIDELNQCVSDLGVYTDYIKFGVDNGKPCIILGETDSNFKVVITNTNIRFMEGSSTPAYISNQALNIGDAVINNELRQGGFAWVARSNGNYGLVWKG